MSSDIYDLRFIIELDELFAEDRKLFEMQGGNPEYAAFDFLAETVFDFTLYDTTKSVQWSCEMLTVIAAILEDKTFEMFNSPVLEEVYLKMVNMPFMQGMLTWGGSIRGAIFDTYGDRIFDIAGISVEQKNLKLFMSALLAWAKDNTSYELTRLSDE